MSLVFKRFMGSSCPLHHRYYTDIDKVWSLEKMKKSRSRVFGWIFKRGEVDMDKEMNAKSSTQNPQQKTKTESTYKKKFS